MPKQIVLSTFSIVAHSPVEGSWGVAVASKFLAVGAIVPFAKPGVGAIAVQSVAEPSYGERALALMAQGIGASTVLMKLLENDSLREDRQLGIIDSKGDAVSFTGDRCMAWAGGRIGSHYAVQGNILAGERVIQTMAESFERSEGGLADRLYEALLAGDRAGGDRRGKQSAALFVATPKSVDSDSLNRYIDLRVDDHADPVWQLGNLLQSHHLFFGSSDHAARVKLEGLLVRDFKSLLKRLGYYAGDIDDIWETDVQRAFIEFIEVENLEARVDYENAFIDPPALDYIRARFHLGSTTT